MRSRFSSSFTFLAAVASLFAANGATAANRLVPAQEGGAIRAFIVGIDRYASKKPLKGARADAEDLYASLRDLGVPEKNMTRLFDEAATRKAFVAGMNRLVKEARPRDLVIISFAGHGAQMKEMHKNTKPDHLDEVYVLTQFHESTSNGLAERVHGPEMKRWLSDLDKKNVEVLFIADTCHGGGLTRAVDWRQAEFSYRAASINIAEAAEDTLQPESTPADAMLTESSFRNVTFLAAVDRHSKAPEVPVAGQKTLRGALSYAVARAFHGAAAAGGQGAVTRRQLVEYANQQILQLAEGRQHPYHEPKRPDALDTVVFRTVDGETPEPTSDRATALRIRVLNGDASAIAGSKPLMATLTATEDGSQADLVWDAGAKEVLSGGDVVARKVAAEDIPWIADRIAASRAIAALTVERSQQIVLTPNDGLHHLDEPIAFVAPRLKGKHLIVFNMAGNGVVQYQFPLQGDPTPLAEDEWKMPLKVTPPFGLDQVVAIVSDQRLTDLEAELRELDNRPAVGRAPEILRKHIERHPDIRIGFATVATAP